MKLELSVSDLAWPASAPEDPSCAEPVWTAFWLRVKPPPLSVAHTSQYMPHVIAQTWLLRTVVATVVVVVIVVTALGGFGGGSLLRCLGRSCGLGVVTSVLTVVASILTVVSSILTVVASILTLTLTTESVLSGGESNIDTIPATEY